VPATKIKDVIEHDGLSFDPVKDDVTNSKNISLAISSRQSAKVPLIIGSNADDGSAFAIIFGGGIADDTSSTIFKATAQSLTELTFQCPAASIADLAAASGYPSIYRYFFNASFPQYQPFKGAGAYHEAEILQVFGTYNKSRIEMNRLSGSMQTKWTDFAKDPSSPIAGWPKVVAGKQQALVFGNTEDKVVDASTIDSNCASMAADIAIGGL
jgi:carboxylesterase type B